MRTRPDPIECARQSRIDCRFRVSETGCVEASYDLVGSYQGEHLQQTQRIANAMESRGLRVWLAPRDQTATRKQRAARFAEALRDARACVVFLPTGRLSRRQSTEISLLPERVAMEPELQLVSVLLNGGSIPQSLPEPLNRATTLDLRVRSDEQVGEGVAAFLRGEPVPEAPSGSVLGDAADDALTGAGSGQMSAAAVGNGSQDAAAESTDEEGPQGPVSGRYPTRSYVGDRKRWRGLRQWVKPLPNRPKLMPLTRDEIESKLPRQMSPEIASGVLEEAAGVVARRDERIATAEAKATTLLGTVAIAASLIIAGSGLILDPGKVADAWRRVLMLIVLALLICLLMCGYTASRALLQVLN